jgi:MYXO-CTERM domain-containing protein
MSSVRARVYGTVMLGGLGTLVACMSAQTTDENEQIGTTKEELGAAGQPAAAEKMLGPAGLPRGMMATTFAREQYEEAQIEAPLACALTYFGGPVIGRPKVYQIYWGSTVDTTLKNNLPQFYQDILNSSYWDWLSQYNTVGLAAPTTSQAISRGSFISAHTITPSVCATPPCTVTDDQVQTELLAQINAGVIPAPTLGCDGQVDSLYMFDFPSGVTITRSGSTSCVQFCAYHFSTTTTYSIGGTPVHVPYGIHPYIGSGSPCGSGCGSVANYLNNATSVHSHQLVEIVTDTQVAQAATFGYPLAWYAQAGCNPNGEISDICNGQQATVTVSARTWTVQKQWSNKSGACVTTDTVAPICTNGSAPPGCRPCACTDNGVACTGSTPVCETDQTNLKKNSCVQCTSSSQCIGPQVCLKTNVGATDDTCGANPCGNGTLDAGEQCDDGANNGTAGSCCSATCTFRAAAQVCRAAANGCDAAETCTGSSSTCPADAKQPNDTPCNDGNPCTTGDVCTAGACGGAPKVCAPQDECHDAGTCDAVSGACSNPAKGNGTPCSIGTCQSGVCTGTSSDAGTDSGSADSGTPADAGTAGDSGTPPDAGTAGDSGTPPDAGAAGDSGAPPDAGAGVDSGSGRGDSGSPSADAAADAGDQGTQAPGEDSGCGCRTVGATGSSGPLAPLGLGALAALAVIRRRKRRGDAARCAES